MDVVVVDTAASATSGVETGASDSRRGVTVVLALERSKPKTQFLGLQHGALWQLGKLGAASLSEIGRLQVKAKFGHAVAVDVCY